MLNEMLHIVCPLVRSSKEETFPLASNQSPPPPCLLPTNSMRTQVRTEHMGHFSSLILALLAIGRLKHAQ